MPTTYAESSVTFSEVKTQKVVDEGEAASILFMCDFPPSNLRGGPVLISRLLESYPRNRIVVLSGSYFDRISPEEGRLCCKQFFFPTSNETGRWGLGRIKSLIDWLLIPVLGLYGIWVVKNHNTEVIVTIGHGHFFVAAALTSWVIGVPMVLIVHDDWVGEMLRGSFVLKHFCIRIFQFVTRRAAHVYAVSPSMRDMLAMKYGVASEVQMPGIEPEIDANASPTLARNNDECLRILYAGSLSAAVDDSLNILVELIKADKLSGYGIKSWELLLFVPVAPEQARAAGWNHEKIKVQGWVSQEELKAALTTADILFLPYSFRDEERFATSQAFPSKTTDYLMSGKSILILAPPYSSVARYANEFGFAEIVVEPSEEKLAQSIARIWSSAVYREELAVNSRAALHANHDINKQRAEFRVLLNHLAQETTGATISSPA
jgi:glycosyltransferase involved in cell wall biosynthesis